MARALHGDTNGTTEIEGKVHPRTDHEVPDG